MNTLSESLKARNIYIFQHFSFYEQLKIHAQLSWARKKFYNFGARLGKHMQNELLAVLLFQLTLQQKGWLILH